MGGEYITWFNEEGSEARRLLYKLESMGITRLCRELVKLKGDNFYQYHWILTDKGQKLVDDNESLQGIWKYDGGAIEVGTFYNEVMKIIKGQEEKNQNEIKKTG